MVDEILDHAGRLDGAQALLVEHDGHLGKQAAKGLVRVLPPPQPYHCPEHRHQGPSLAWWHEASPGRVSARVSGWASSRTAGYPPTPAVRGLEILHCQACHVGLSRLRTAQSHYSHCTHGTGPPGLCTTHPSGPLCRGSSTRTLAVGGGAPRGWGQEVEDKGSGIGRP